uniref:HTH CENPB-type domain-containing protein n=1 Tax=Strongyloides stercoralis TaxID=6248 RepID=A0A0K0EBZ4_STRER
MSAVSIACACVCKVSMSGRKSYTAAFKLKAVNYGRNHGTSAAAIHYNVSDRLIRRWTSEKSKLGALLTTKRACRFKKPLLGEIEQQLLEWVNERRSRNRSVSILDIRKHAKKITEESGFANFQSSAQWSQRFMVRNSLSMRRRTSVGQPLPADYRTKRTEFQRFVQTESLNISPHNIVNLDEVPVPFDVVYERTVNTRGQNNVKITSTGHEKSNFTVVLATTAAGEQLKIMIIFKKKLLPKGPFPDNVVVKANTKGWMTKELMQE